MFDSSIIWPVASFKEYIHMELDVMKFTIKMGSLKNIVNM
jgi:hypothetical protein